MSTPAKPQNVCKACRSRKKKCDGNRPSCESCLKRGELCLYERVNSRNSRHHSRLKFPNDITDSGIPQQLWDWPVTAGNAFLLTEAQEPTFPQLPNELPFMDSLAWMNLPPENMPNASEDDSPSMPRSLPTPQDSVSPPPAASLPAFPVLLELIDLFFDKYHYYFPIIHQSTFLSRLMSDGVEGTSKLLLFAMIAISGGSHHNGEIRQSQLAWFEEAKSMASKDMQSRENATRTLQAAVLIIYQGIALTDYSTSLIVLGEAWRKAVGMGCASRRGLKNLRVPWFGMEPTESWVEEEEIRRAFWMLFIMDRGICFPIGLAYAIDDRRLRIDFPISEAVFRNNDEPAEEHTVHYTHDFDKLLTSVQELCRKGSPTHFQFLILGYLLLGRISETAECPDYDIEERSRRLDDLASQLVRLRLMLPRSATELSAASHYDFSYVLWVNAVLSTCTVLLHHRELRDGEKPDDAGTEMATNWPHCVAAARSMVASIRDSSRASVDFTNNAHLACLLFTSCRILIIEYFCPSVSRRHDAPLQDSHPSTNRDPKLREDLEVIALTFKRTQEALHGLGQKFGKGMCFYLNKGAGFAQKFKVGGARCLLGACDRWQDVPNDYELIIPS